MLIVFGGLPGTGKTTIARPLARRLQAVHVRLDTIEQAMRSCDVLKGDVGPTGYVVAYGVAEDNLRVGRIVVADTVNPVQATRDAWLDVARRTGARAIEVEVISSDATGHRRRVKTRTADIEGHQLPTWQAVVDRHYETWDRSHIVVDTALLDVDEQVSALVSRLGS
ncbi:MAG: AAA family ATPase [Rhodospirillales bacterium]|nr:AAA family ATPase [Rhodospirillales bacterium]